MLPDIIESVAIDAGRERVWTVLTTPALVEQWLGCIGFRPEVGTLFYMQPDPAKRAAGSVDGATHCELEAIEPQQAIRFSWFMPGTPKTQVAIELDALSDERTEVRLTHTGWDQFDDESIRPIRDMLAGGWKSHVLPGLRRVVEETKSAA